MGHAKGFRALCGARPRPRSFCLILNLVEYRWAVTLEVLTPDVFGGLLEAIQKSILAAPDCSFTANERLNRGPRPEYSIVEGRISEFVVDHVEIY